jgi:hypothetical protein
MKLRSLNTQSAPINTQPMLNEVSGMTRFRGSYSLCGFITSIDKNGQPYRKIGACVFNHHLFIHTRDMDYSFIDIATYQNQSHLTANEWDMRTLSYPLINTTSLMRNY